MSAITARCLRCHREFVRRRAGHVFCSSACRHRGPRRPEDPPSLTDEELSRLFDDRPDAARVAADDWHPARGTGWEKLDACQALGQRRRWFRNLVESGQL